MSHNPQHDNSKKLETLSDEEIRRRFDELDLNKNGLIEWGETLQALQALGIPEVVGEKRWKNAMIKEFGREKAHLTYEEFAQYIRHREREIAQLFAAVDTNGDGLISRDELQHALKEHGLAHGADMMNEIFTALDLDQSGDIDVNEWKKVLFLSPSCELEEMMKDWADISAMGKSNVPVPPLKKHSTLEQAAKQVAIGTFAGSIAKTALAPLSRIKVIIQIAEKSQSLSTAVGQIYQEGGLRAFYRGNFANIIKSGPETGAKLLMFDVLKEKFASSDGHLTPQARFVAGGLSSIFSHGLFYPLDLIKIRLEATPHGTYTGMIHCAQTIYQAEGFVPAFYRGLVPVCFSTFPSSGITLGLYNYLSDKIRATYGEQASAKQFAYASTFAALVSEVTTYPMHLAKSRLATQGSPGIPKKYNGLMDFFTKVYATDGVRGFYRGLVPACVKHVPSVAITMTTYDVLKKYFGISKPSKHH